MGSNDLTCQKKLLHIRRHKTSPSWLSQDRSASEPTVSTDHSTRMILNIHTRVRSAIGEQQANTISSRDSQYWPTTTTRDHPPAELRADRGSHRQSRYAHQDFQRLAWTKSVKNAGPGACSQDGSAWCGGAVAVNVPLDIIVQCS